MDKSETIELVKKFSNANGAPGFENEPAKIFDDYCQKFGETSIDTMQNAFCKFNGNTGNRPLVQIDAHEDSVGFIVQAIRPSGLIKFVPLGGVVPTNMPASRVRVRNKNGDYLPGIISTKPPHFMTAAEKGKVPEIADMSIDVGTTSRQQTIEELQIDTGCPIVMDVTCQYYEYNDMFLGKDFDDRIGCAAVVKTLETLQRKKLDVDVIAALSAQEEVGLRGAYVTARKINPDVGIVFEGCPCDDTFEPDWLIQTGMGCGPMLRDMDTSFIANPAFEEFSDQVATKLGIPHTRSVRTGGGVNGAAITYYNGVPTIVIGIPVRYEHTEYNWTKLSDLEDSVKLAVGIIEELNKEILESF